MMTLHRYNSHSKPDSFGKKAHTYVTVDHFMPVVENSQKVMRQIGPHCDTRESAVQCTKHNLASVVISLFFCPCVTGVLHRFLVLVDRAHIFELQPFHSATQSITSSCITQSIIHKLVSIMQDWINDKCLGLLDRPAIGFKYANKTSNAFINQTS